MRAIKVLLVDDHPVYRRGLKDVLESREGIEIIGETGDGGAAIELAVTRRPDAVLMDVALPDRDGILVTRTLLERVPGTCVLILTASVDEQHLRAALNAGARGFLGKEMEPEQIIEAVHLALEGEAVIPHRMALSLLPGSSGAVRKNHPGESPDLNLLTARERQVLSLLAHGETNKEMGRKMGLSEQTVKIHLRNILRKLHVQNRIQAAVYAHQQGLASVPSSDPAEPIHLKS